jgi:hypothetical protein
MELIDLVTSILLSAFTFVLGWLIGIERRNKQSKDLAIWKAYAEELKLDANNLKQL